MSEEGGDTILDPENHESLKYDVEGDDIITRDSTGVETPKDGVD